MPERLILCFLVALCPCGPVPGWWSRRTPYCVAPSGTVNGFEPITPVQLMAQVAAHPAPPLISTAPAQVLMHDLAIAMTAPGWLERDAARRGAKILSLNDGQ
jgi:hypothetical protein